MRVSLFNFSAKYSGSLFFLILNTVTSVIDYQLIYSQPLNLVKEVFLSSSWWRMGHVLSCFILEYLYIILNVRLVATTEQRNAINHDTVGDSLSSVIGNQILDLVQASQPRFQLQLKIVDLSIPLKITLNGAPQQ